MAFFKPTSSRLRAGAALGGIVCIMSMLIGLAGGEELHTRNPHEVMANYLRVLPAYVEWPTNTFTSQTEPWRIGILGTDPFGELLEKTLRDRKVGERGFEIWHATELADLPPCQIIFIAGKDADEIKEILRALHSRPVLTVSDHDNFLTLGGIIELQARDTVRMSINLDHAQAAHLKIPRKMLEVASEVIENGGRRKLKE